MPTHRAGVLHRVGAMLRSTDDRGGEAPAADRPDDLRARVDRLESMVEGLQDALYRHAQHEDARIDALQRQRRDP